MHNVTDAYLGAAIHDGRFVHEARALAVLDTGEMRLSDPAALPPACRVIRLKGGLITPGFVDLQVNGGGGRMFNDDPSLETVEIMAQAQRGLGTSGFLPTLISDTPEQTRAAIDAVAEALQVGVEGVVGLHLEGPHLAQARKGAHAAEMIRPMEPQDLDLLLEAAARLPNLMVTVAPETVSPAQISAMSQAGILVSLGHTDADYATCMAAFDAGARCVTHLFNAMSQLTPRAPGLVGAALDREGIYAGLIADGIHVHPASIRAALGAKRDAQNIFLVSDVMATAGSDIDRFTLNGREIFRAEGRLTLADGTLAGADLEISRALQVMTQDVGDDLSQAVARATSVPAGLLSQAKGLGCFGEGARKALYFKSGFGGTPDILTPQSGAD